MITDRPSNNGATGSGMQNKSSTLDDAKTKASELGSMVGEKASQAASYVRERGISGLQADISDAAVRHPLGAVFVSLGVGYFLGRLMTPRR